MAIVGIEWIVAGVIVLVIIVWGPNNIPKLARAVGLARKEFEKAQKELVNPSTEGPANARTDEENLINAAQSVGIETAGKTREELLREIVGKAKQGSGQFAPRSSAATGASNVRIASPEAKELNESERLLNVARGLGIEVEGKTRDQLKAEIRKALG